ncbi:MAG: CYTH domain-containing protein [Clostridiaceae bacterium]|nr:CYTH domain-containing protein [Clostridiaceae bacterium]
MEIEYKYRVPDIDTFGAISRDKLLSSAVRIAMDAKYYDTPERILRAGAVTLRLRREDIAGGHAATVCCVKMPAPGGDALEAGLRRRLEFECEADTVEEGLRTLFAQGVPADLLRAACKRGLEPTATVRYTRLEAVVSAETASAASAVYTVCLDRGILGITPFMEMEIEHRSGDFAVTAAAAHALAARYALVPEERSKYARALL